MFNPSRKLNHAQILLTADQYRKLVANFEAEQEDHVPVVKYFYGSATWLLTEVNPETGVAFGLCDLGQGFPELGAVCLNEMADIGRVERDIASRLTSC